jgi:general secretion pathway protein E
MTKKKYIGEILVENGACTAGQVDECLEIQQSGGDGRRIGEIMRDKGYINEDDLLEALSIQIGIPYIREIREEMVDKVLVSQLPFGFAKKNKIIPLYADNGTVTVAVCDPLDVQPLDDARLILHKDIETIMSREVEIIDALNKYYHTDAKAAERVIEDMQEEDKASEDVFHIEEVTEDLLDMSEKAPIIKLVNLIIFQAVKQHASDIHIEAFEDEMRVRYRIDGVLYPRVSPPKQYQASIISRIKIMAKLNIAEKRLPQDGKMMIKVGDREVDIRVSVIPTTHGERIVLRLLDRASIFIGLENLGLHSDTLETFDRILKLSHGIMLVTGPTGSGKTTTLYASLAKINSDTVNIITIEDPVEYQLKGIGQIHVRPQIDLTFANGLRSILRQDPDVIMVGEIRDRETAEISTHASLTGHLVFSTLHTNDAAGAITRLVDMKIEPYLVSSTVVGIMAQRLVRNICPNCKEEYKPEVQALQNIGLDPDKLNGDVVYRGRGCSKCFETGYAGRSGIYELLIVDNDVRSMILDHTDANTIKMACVEKGMRSLRGDGAMKVAEGVTTIEEVMRVTQEDIEY